MEMNLMIKRVIDIVISGTALLVLSVPLMIIAIIVRITSDGPVFYAAKRVGLGGKIINVYKFRSMVINADRIGPKVTGSNDPRITSIGRILRKTKMDELPQLFNVLLGDMSLVGPRPEDPRYVAMYTLEQRNLILSVRPGITGAASVEYRHEESMLSCVNREEVYVQQVMPAKLAIDMEYVQNLTILRDVKIVLDTVRAL